MLQRHRFLTLASGSLSATLLLAGCMGNPSAGPGAGTSSGTALDQAASAKLETDTIKLGYIPILEDPPWGLGWRKASAPSRA
jgi:bicarbonate transport system substrate-binding protein